MIPFRVEEILPVDVSADLAEKTILGEKEGKYIQAVVDFSDSFNGDGTTTSFNLTHKPVVAGSVNVLVDGSAVDVSVDYENGVITFDSAPASGASILVNYKYYAAEPCAVLLEAVTTGQSPAAAKMLLFGEMYEDEFESELLEEVKAKLRKNGVFIKKRIVV